MKILCYTITDFKQGSLECIDLLYSSLLLNNHDNFDFYVVSNIKPAFKIKYPLILASDLKSFNIIYTKYTELLPDTYDYYIYLDSDILFFDKLESIISDKDYSIVTEKKIGQIKDNPWFAYRNATNEEKLDFTKIAPINAGTFAFSKFTILNYIRSIFLNNIFTQFSAIENVQFEQSCFNYSIYKLCGINYDSCYDISDKIELFAKTITNKQVYHFCGFTNEMASKYIRMKNFYDQYQNRFYKA